jgi:hypothetical protein
MSILSRSILSRLAPAIMIAGLLLAGCAHQQPATRTTGTSPATPSSTTRASSATHRDHSSATGNTSPREHTSTTGSAAVDDANPSDATGIAACDDYLSSYLACHRAAAIYAPDQLQSRYQAMRTSLLRDSKNPDIRPHLAARCNSLATQLRQALHGKSCAANPASASSTP